MDQHHQLSDSIRHYLSARKRPLVDMEGPRVVVNEAVGALAFYYEKLRSVVDFQDEHLLRQNAIRRNLSRRYILQQSPEMIAKLLVRDLVRARYFPNNYIALAAADSIAPLLERYFAIIEALRKQRMLSDRDQEWLLSMAACGISELLAPPTEGEALVHLMYQTLEPNVDLEDSPIDEATRRKQIYITVYRVIMKPDLRSLQYFLLKHSFQEWGSRGTADGETLAREYRHVRDSLQAQIEHPLNKKLFTSFKKYRISLIVLATVLQNNQEEILENPEAFAAEINRICEGFYEVQQQKLKARTFRAFLYIFITKMTLGLALEVPYDLLISRGIHYLPLAINIITPPLILMAITLSVRTPGRENTARIVQSLFEMVYADHPREVFIPKAYVEKKKNSLSTVLFWALYLGVFGLACWIGWTLLKLIQFNLMSGGLFFLFLCLVTFFGVNLRKAVKDLWVITQKRNAAVVFLDPLLLPIMQVGRFLSANVSKVNVFVFLFDVLIELPLVALFEITEEWFAFIKEKKEELE